MRENRRWCCEKFDQITDLILEEPVRHVSLFEAQAFCVWAGRRLPTEAEWNMAALLESPHFQWGTLWEWTSSPIKPFEGFVADAYREYSAPWFGTQQVARGASFATAECLKSVAYRNFYAPSRNDVFIGFRKCKI